MGRARRAGCFADCFTVLHRGGNRRAAEAQCPAALMASCFSTKRQSQ